MLVAGSLALILTAVPASLLCLGKPELALLSVMGLGLALLLVRLREPWLLLAIGLPLWVIGELSLEAGPLGINPPVVMGSLAAGLLIWRLLSARKTFLSWRPLLLPALLLVATTTLATCWGHPVYGPSHLGKLISAVALFVVMSSSLTSPALMERFAKVFLVGAALVLGVLSAWYLLHFHYNALGIYLTEATTLGKNRAGYFVTLALPLALAFFLHYPRKWQAGALLGIIAFATLYTLSRGAWVAVGFSLLCMLGFSSHRRQLAQALALIGLVVMPLLLLFPSQLGRLSERATTLVTLTETGVSTSIYQRATLTEAAFAAFAEAPLTGLGVGQIELIDPTGLGYRSSHDDYAQIAAEQGILGLAAFCSLMALVLVRSIKLILKAPRLQIPWIAEGFGAVGCALVVRHCFIYAYDTPAFWTMLALISACSLLPEASKAKEKTSPKAAPASAGTLYAYPASEHYAREGASVEAAICVQ